MSPRTLLITGGAGFIGSEVCRQALTRGDKVVILDALTYAGSWKNVEGIPGDLECVQGRIEDRELTRKLLTQFKPSAIINLAAESHVDRSIEGAAPFLQTNIVGTFSLLEEARNWSAREKTPVRWVQVSTDEVFGSLGPSDAPFCESTRYEPRSPYSASKAGADHLVMAWHHTYGMDALITNCSNNYGYRQHPEKLIPRTILRSLAGRKIPVYGRGENVRDWIHVEDHARGILLALDRGKAGESYLFGGRSERSNIDVVRKICQELNKIAPHPKGGDYLDQIEFVTDRLGHDFRYSVDSSKSERELGWKTEKNFEKSLSETVRWYFEHADELKKEYGDVP